MESRDKFPLPTFVLSRRAVAVGRVASLVAAVVPDHFAQQPLRLVVLQLVAAAAKRRRRRGQQQRGQHPKVPDRLHERADRAPREGVRQGELHLEAEAVRVGRRVEPPGKHDQGKQAKNSPF